MAESTNINLPSSHVPQFPDRCVVCDCHSPGSQVRIMTFSIGWWTWSIGCFGKPVFTQAPACRGCAWKLHGMRCVDECLTIIIALAVYWCIWPYFKHLVVAALRKWVFAALALVCLFPKFIVQVFFAMPFAITAKAKSIDYEFASLEYACDFAVLNKDAEWVKINGTLFTE